MDNSASLKKQQEKKMTDFYAVSIILSMAGGFFDSYSFLCRDRVFANAQTGNMVLLAVNVIEQNWFHALLYFCPIFAFMVGILIAEFLKEKFKDHPKIHWHQMIVVFEIIIVACIGLIPNGKLNTLANILISFTCSIQYQGFKRIEGKPYASTMCTGNLRSATVNFFRFMVSKNKENLYTSGKYFLSIICFIFGALTGAILVPQFGVKSIYVTILELIIVLVLLIQGEKISTRNKQE